MATITTIKQYEFCDEIKQHILSYLGAKKMKLTDLTLNRKIQILSKSIPAEIKPKHIYKLRMLISKEQYNYERSKIGIKHRKKIRDEMNMEFLRKKLYCDINNYWRVKLNPFGGLDGSILPYFELDTEEYNNFIKKIYNPYQKLIFKGLYKDEKEGHLWEIRCAGKKFQLKQSQNT
jgi:hypothetical protein